MNAERGCNCGCGKPRNVVIREIMTTESLNEYQAEARLDWANQARTDRARLDRVLEGNDK